MGYQGHHPLRAALLWRHNGAVASQITSLTMVYSTVHSDADQRKHQSSSSLASVRGIHRGPVNSPHERPVMFPFDDVIMIFSGLNASKTQLFDISYCRSISITGYQITGNSIVCSAVHANNKEKYQSWALLTLCGRSTGTGGFPSPSVSNAENLPCDYDFVFTHCRSKPPDRAEERWTLFWIPVLPSAEECCHGPAKQ